MDDPAASSHWRGLLAEADKCGLPAAITFARRRGGAHALLHSVFQNRYERMGRSLPLFPALNRLTHNMAARQGRLRDLDMLRQALTVACVAKHADLDRKTIAVIGDGYGVLGSLVLLQFPHSRLVTVNLTRMLQADVEMTRRAIPGLAAGRLAAIEARDSRKLRDHKIDVAFNVCSMQEMDPPVIAEYFSHLRVSGALFYCCNRIEKTLPDGTVVRFTAYPWAREDRSLINEPCPWSQDYYNIRPPFIRRYDGPIWHRLARLAAK